MSSQRLNEVWTHHEAIINGVRLHYVAAGEGPLVILLHGFLEFWYAWRYQIPALAESGFRVIAPDMRGYNTSEKPVGIRSYRLETLVDDVVGLVRHAGESRAVIAGDDWGGGIAWAVVIQRPDVVDKLIALNAPHPAAFLQELRTLEQMRRSWYMLFFQLPWLPEMAFRFGNYALIDRVLRRDPVRADAFSEDDIRQYKQAAAQPGALTAGVNYYRAAFRRNPIPAIRDLRRTVHAPTLLVWGEQDRYLSPSLAERTKRWASNIRVERLPDASHWVQIDARERVSQLMTDFLHG